MPENPILQKIMLEQVKMDAQAAKDALKEQQKEHQKIQKEHEKMKKKAETLEKENKEHRKELHRLKLQYDAPYAFENKQVKKEVMARARAAKTKKTQGVRELTKKAKAK